MCGSCRLTHIFTSSRLALEPKISFLDGHYRITGLGDADNSAGKYTAILINVGVAHHIAEGILDNQDVRWKQRFANYRKALSQLKKFIDKGSLSELEKQGLIKAFEYTYELAWNTLRDFLLYKGQTEIYGSRDAFRRAFTAGLISDGEGWMDMLQSRNRTTHTYNEDTAEEIAIAITTKYFPMFQQLEKKMLSVAKESEEQEK